MTPIHNEKDALLGHREVKDGSDLEEIDDDAEYQHREFVPLQDRAWSFSHSRVQVATNAATISSPQISVESRHVEESAKSRTTKEQPLVSSAGQHYIFCFIYAVVNVIIAVPGLFGYAAVIFNHPIYANHMNALSKCK
jgi:hypothetical protein